MTDDSTAADAATEPDRVLGADVVTYTDAPDECTLSPEDVQDDRTTTAWITARGDAFVALDEVR